MREIVGSLWNWERQGKCPLSYYLFPRRPSPWPQCTLQTKQWVTFKGHSMTFHLFIPRLCFVVLSSHFCMFLAPKLRVFKKVVCLPVIPTLRRLIQKGLKLETSLDYVMKPCLKNKTTTTNKQTKEFIILTQDLQPILRLAPEDCWTHSQVPSPCAVASAPFPQGPCHSNPPFVELL
jgi:hypothetical protein